MRSSFENAQEAALVVALLSRLVAFGLRRRRGSSRLCLEAEDSGGKGGGSGKVRVGVIAPYRGQVRRIQQELGDYWRLKGSPEDGGVNVEVRPYSSPPHHPPANISYNLLRLAFGQPGQFFCRGRM